MKHPSQVLQARHLGSSEREEGSTPRASSTSSNPGSAHPGNSGGGSASYNEGLTLSSSPRSYRGF